MIVTDIVEISKKQCGIKIDYEFAFVLYKGELHLYGIKKGESISEQQYCHIVDEVLVKRAKLRAMNLLMKQSYTEKKLREKLQSGKYPAKCIDAAMEYVKSFGYVNDRQYAEDFLFYHADKLSRQQIFQKLKTKGVPDEIIEECYRDFYADSNSVTKKNHALIHHYLKKKKFAGWSDTDYEARNKIIRSILQKGFQYDDILYCMKSVGQNDEY